ncbi:hypothetical protein, partial [Vibrio parahaemolyticus]|uniref:hypothetical protein n=1 Tax=Vibrio parahaemolyticus TaxID=670 RepID=UPI001F5D607D
MKEQKEYEKEIEWQFIDFGLNLQPTIDLIEMSNGIFNILDKLSIMSSATEERLMSDIAKLSKFKPALFDKYSFH